MNASMKPAASRNEPGLLLGFALISVLATLFLATMLSGFHPGPVRKGRADVFLGLYIMAWGAMYLASYYFSHKTFFLRGLMWTCERFSHPRGRGMAFFYAALALGLGGLATLTGLGLIG